MENKKNPNADVNKKKGLFLALGLLVSLGLTLAAFEWKQFGAGELMDLGLATDDFEELMEISSYRTAASKTTTDPTTSNH